MQTTRNTPDTRPRRATLRAVAVLTAVATLSACGGGPGSAHNDADVAFASDMVVHHGQALEMAQAVDGKDVSPEVEELAAEIEAAQGPEIEQMSGWLEEWGEEVPDPMGHSGMDMDMPGMMTSEDMDALEGAEGDQFEQLWLSMMVEHHQGAVEMAETEQAEGEYDEAVALAGEIVETQTEEIERMQALLEQS